MDRRIFLLAGSALALSGTVAEASNSWRRLGTRSVSWHVDHDVFVVTGLSGTFDHLMFKVTGNDIFILDVDVFYGNGAPDHIPLSFHIPRNGQSRVINLRGGNRIINRVAFTYKRHVDGGGPALVELWGQR